MHLSTEQLVRLRSGPSTQHILEFEMCNIHGVASEIATDNTFFKTAEMRAPPNKRDLRGRLLIWYRTDDHVTCHELAAPPTVVL
jgi:hypothetical protein